jgi:signal transduction histidine kinase/CheY-like chemotaxis protein
MSTPGDITRLNILIELFSECANSTDLDAMLRVAATRLRWVIDFDRCLFVLERNQQRGYRVQTAHSHVSRVEFASLSDVETTLIDRVFESGAPAGKPPHAFCVPIPVAGRTIGAIFFSSESTGYSHRDLRLGHHAGQYLGSLIARLDLEADAKRRISRKDDLLALLGHELRNPLAPITTAVHILMASAKGEPSKELAIIHRQTQHLVRLVDDLLDVARLTRGKMTLRRKPIEIAQVLALALEMVSPLLQKRQHLLAIDVPPSGLVVNGDLSRLAQVVSNLLSNAARYTEPHGHISVTAVGDGQTVVIDVCDDGVGIPDETLADVFDLFVQGPKQAGADGGLGLGLAVVKQFTELHGGSVAVASRDDQRGTKFTIRLPLEPAGSVAVAPSEAPPPSTAKARQRVLLVDDNEDALDLLSFFLEGQGHVVKVARDGVEALGVLDRFLPSVAVIDITMPVMGGYELAERIRAQDSGAQISLVALTGYGQETDRERSRAAGFDEHLVKPVDLELLSRVVERGKRHIATLEQHSPTT